MNLRCSKNDCEMSLCVSSLGIHKWGKLGMPKEVEETPALPWGLISALQRNFGWALGMPLSHRSSPTALHLLLNMHWNQHFYLKPIPQVLQRLRTLRLERPGLQTTSTPC